MPSGLRCGATMPSRLHEQPIFLNHWERWIWWNHGCWKWQLSVDHFQCIGIHVLQRPGPHRKRTDLWPGGVSGGAKRGRRRHHRLQLGQHRMLRFRLGGSGGRQLQRRPLCGGSQQSVGLHAVERWQRLCWSELLCCLSGRWHVEWPGHQSFYGWLRKE